MLAREGGGKRVITNWKISSLRSEQEKRGGVTHRDREKSKSPPNQGGEVGNEGRTDHPSK